MARNAGLVQPRSGKPLAKTNVHRVLRNRVYSGDFDWSGKRYRGVYTPIVSTQDALDASSREF